MRFWVLGILLLSLLQIHSAFAGRGDSESFDQNQKGVALESKNKVREYFKNELKIKIEKTAPEYLQYNLTLKVLQKVSGSESLDTLEGLSGNRKGLPEDIKKRLLEELSTQNPKVLAEIIRTFWMPKNPHALVIAKAGVGKTHTMMQVVAAMSFGVLPDNLRQELGLPLSSELPPNESILDFLQKSDSAKFPFHKPLAAFLGNTNFFNVDRELLNKFQAENGVPIPKSEDRWILVLRGLYDAANEDFNKNGRRSILVFDEVAQFDKVVHQVLKLIQNQNGFKDPTHPQQKVQDTGVGLAGMTTPEEMPKMKVDDSPSAIERRWIKIFLPEPSEEQAFQIIKSYQKSWEATYGIQLDDAAIWYLIRMRNLFQNPPLAMPDSIIQIVTRFIMWSPERAKEKWAGPNGENKAPLLNRKDAEDFLISFLNLTDQWREGPNGEPPFWNLAAKLKELVKGQDDVIDQIAEQLKDWVRLGFGEPFVAILGGPSGNGKDTLVDAISLMLYGHKSTSLVEPIGEASGFKIESLIEGPPLGNHSDKRLPRLIQALENNPLGIVRLNEGKDAPKGELNKLKVLFESGVIRPAGIDARERPLINPMFLLGQWGEEEYETTDEYEKVHQIRDEEQVQEIENRLLEDQDFFESKFKNVPYAVYQRAAASGGVYLIRPVSYKYYPDIVKLQIQKLIKEAKEKNQIGISVSDDLVHAISEQAISEKLNPRVLQKIVKDMVRKAISKAMDPVAQPDGSVKKGLPKRSFDVRMSIDRFMPGSSDSSKQLSVSASTIVLSYTGPEGETEKFRIPVKTLRRISTAADTCVTVLEDKILAADSTVAQE